MRVCANCRRENPDDRDFCECGEYLRWDPTGVVQAITPEVVEAARHPAQPEPSAAQPPAPPKPPATLVQPRVPAPPQPQPEPGPAAISLRLPEGAQARVGDALATGVEPGGRARVLALVRNQSGIVDNYDLSVRGLPDGWWSIFPDTVYLVPFGTSGTYEQEVEIHFHPPRSAQAVARIWELQVVAHSRAHERQAAAEPVHLGVQPFEEVTTTVEPQRASGRRKARYEVSVKNTANAPVAVALDHEDPDGDLRVGFSPRTLEVPPGESRPSRMQVRPRRQKWIGRTEEKRLAVHTRTGEEALAMQAAAETPPEAALDDRFKALGGAGPRANIGPGGVQVTGPRAPRAPRLPNKALDLSSLKVPGGGAPSPSQSLQPNQVVFRHKAWLPWWSMLLVALLILLALVLFLFLPRNVTVPDVTGAKSAFDAEQALTKAELKLAPAPKQEVSTDARPGTVISQTPAAGEKAEKGSEVAVLIAIGDGNATVPKITGLKLAGAEKALRGAKLTVGQITPQPPDPEGTIESQIPAAGDVVPTGMPISVFFGRPASPESMKSQQEKNAAKKAAKKAVGGPVPAVKPGTTAAALSQQVAALGIVPKTVNAYNKAKRGTVFATDPSAGTKLEAGDTLRLFVSAGLPQLTFDNGENVLLVDGNAKPLDSIAHGSAVEKDPTFAPAGRRVAYTTDAQLYVIDLDKADPTARRLTDDSRAYSDPAWAPAVDRDVVAMAATANGESQLCLGAITAGEMITRCKPEPGTFIGRAIHWTRGGREILAFARRDALGQSGIMRWRSTRPFSTRPGDWSAGEFVTDVSTPGQGVVDAAVSPDGKRLAAAANLGSGFRLYLTRAGDFPLSQAKETRLRACKLTWRPDSKALAVVEADAACDEDVGTLVTVRLRDPNRTQLIDSQGDNPSFEPLAVTP